VDFIYCGFFRTPSDRGGDVMATVSGILLFEAVMPKKIRQQFVGGLK
jgi:hypothetical protein